MANRKRVLVAMSGGVDSSVAACLLAEQGHDVVGVFMRLGVEAVADPPACDDPTRTPAPEDESLRLPVVGDSAGGDRHRGCCSAADATDARAVAGRIGIPFYSLNFEADFSKLIDHFADEYAQARTPNPCVRCNQWLKFGRLLEYADVVEADLIATGHYARVDRTGGRPRLLRAADTRKDQSYVLFGISPAALMRTSFPLGEMTKETVRSHARRFGLRLHDKPESQDICFVPDRDYARVVRSRRPNAFRPGEIRHVDGRTLGTHDGIPNFTIGQRRGVNVAVGSPVYVTAIDAATNTVTVGPREDVMGRTLHASGMNWWIESPPGPFRATVKIRYQHDAATATVHPLPENRVRVEFAVPQAAITPGQAAVMYDGDRVLGGGWIDR